MPEKVEEYAFLEIPEYWIVDYRGLGGVAFIGKPKTTDGHGLPTDWRRLHPTTISPESADYFSSAKELTTSSR
jgi:Uma2 family endonuclease